MSEESKIELFPDPTEILTLPAEEPELEYTEEQLLLKTKKEKAQMCKVIALDEMGHHPINANVSNFNKKTKSQLLKRVEALFNEPDADILKQFNDICLDVVFDEKQDLTKYPIYKSVVPLPELPKPIIHKVMDSKGNIIYFSNGDEPSEEIKQQGIYTLE